MVLESYFDIEANDKLLPSNYLSLYHFCKFFCVPSEMYCIIK